MDAEWVRAAFAFPIEPKAGPSDEDIRYLGLSDIKQENLPQAFSAWACSWVVLASLPLPAVLKKRKERKRVDPRLRSFI